MSKIAAPKPMLILRLYVAGNAENSLLAIKNVTTICNEHFAAAYKLEIIDLIKNPSQALLDGIVVTPTLLKLLPLPARRLIGNLEETSHVALILGDK